MTSLRVHVTAILLSGGVLSLATLAFFGVRAGLSAALGVALATGNLWAWARIVSALLPGDAGGAQAQSRTAWILVAGLKVLAWIAIAWLLMRHGLVAIAPMMVGLLSLPIGIAIGSLVSDRSAVPEDS
jgi:hypothetical protein